MIVPFIKGNSALANYVQFIEAFGSTSALTRKVKENNIILYNIRC
jgi:hypothetical protein